MNRKFLENELSCIEDDGDRKKIIDNIMEKNGEAIEKLKTNNETLKNDLKVKDGVINNLNEKIKENEGVDIEAIKQEQFNLGKKEGTKELETFKKSIALKENLKTSKAKDIDLLLKLLDNEKIKYEEKNGKYEVTGLDDQIAEIKKSHDYLFEAEKEKKEPEQRINVGEEHENQPTNTKPNTLAGALHEKYD